MRTMSKRKSDLLTPQRIREIRERLGLNYDQAATKIGVKPRTWQAWEQPSQKREPSASHAILIRLLEAGDL